MPTSASCHEQSTHLCSKEQPVHSEQLAGTVQLHLQLWEPWQMTAPWPCKPPPSRRSNKNAPARPGLSIASVAAHSNFFSKNSDCLSACLVLDAIACNTSDLEKHTEVVREEDGESQIIENNRPLTRCAPHPTNCNNVQCASSGNIQQRTLLGGPHGGKYHVCSSTERWSRKCSMARFRVLGIEILKMSSELQLCACCMVFENQKAKTTNRNWENCKNNLKKRSGKKKSAKFWTHPDLSHFSYPKNQARAEVDLPECQERRPACPGVVLDIGEGQLS